MTAEKPMNGARVIALGGLAFTLALVPVIGQRSGPSSSGGPAGPESRLTNIRQLTSGGENAEAYFSADGQRLIFQMTSDPASASSCDQIYTMRVDGSEKRRISMGGRTTCGYFYPDGQSLLYASTHLASPDCPPNLKGIPPRNRL